MGAYPGICGHAHTQGARSGVREVHVTVANEKGLHTRPSTNLVKLAQTFRSEIFLSLNGVTADAKSVMGVLALGAKKGAILALRAEGADEAVALDSIRGLIEQGVPEDEA